MRTIERLGTFEDVVAGTRPEIEALMRRLRALVLELDPDVIEVPRPGERNAAYGIGERKMSEAYAHLMPQRDWVNLGFYHATALPDPRGLLEGTGASLRHVKVRPGAAADEEVLRELLRAARAERLAALAR